MILYCQRRIIKHKWWDRLTSWSQSCAGEEYCHHVVDDGVFLNRDIFWKVIVQASVHILGHVWKEESFEQRGLLGNIGDICGMWGCFWKVGLAEQRQMTNAAVFMHLFFLLHVKELLDWSIKWTMLDSLLCACQKACCALWWLNWVVLFIWRHWCRGRGDMKQLMSENTWRRVMTKDDGWMDR